MPYAHPAGSSPSTSTPGICTTPNRKATSSASSPSPPLPSPQAALPKRSSPHIRPSQGQSQSPAPSSRLRHLQRIPAPAILPPIVQQTHSALHLTLKSEAGSTLSAQVDDLLARQLNQVVATTSSAQVHVNRVQLDNTNSTTSQQAHLFQKKSSESLSPPSVPPKPPIRTNTGGSPVGPRNMASPNVAPARRPLPVPPPAEEAHQYPASYGPSISKIRSFAAAQAPLPPQYQGLPPGAAHLPASLVAGRQNLGFGYPHPQASSVAQPWTSQARQPPQGQNTVSRTFARGGPSVLLHKGFFDLLSISPYTAPADSIASMEGYSQGWIGDRPTVPVPASGRAVTSPVYLNRAQTAASPLQKGNRRISVDMIGKPTGFTHLAHASDADEAADLLTRWRIDGKGKLAEPGWVAAIKEAARARARARAVAQVQANIDDEHQKGSLKVVNGNPDSLISLFTDQAEHGSRVQVMTASGNEQARTGLPPVSPMPVVQQDPMDDVVIVHDEIPYRPIMPPSTLRMNTANTVIVRSPNALRAMEAEAVNDSSEAPSSPGDLSPFPVRPPLPTQEPKPFKPSLETVEKSVATKIYLENHYYGILKRPRDRDQRRAALERELASANTTDAQRRKIRSAWILSETEHLRSLRNRVTVNSFQKIKTIGHGAFGVVSLVKERGTGELYAMKQLRKADMLRKGQEGHVRAERDVMSAASSNSNCKWIVRLLYSFQDVDHLYLVMEYMGGGDLLNLLIEKDTFDEGFTKFYVAEMVLAIQEAHKLGYIHRDVKPDNFIFSSDGHIKLSDFGLATDLHWAHDGAYYDEQRRQLLRKHGIDLEESNGLIGKRHNGPHADLDLADLPSDSDDGERTRNGGLLTVREKHRKKLAYSVVGTNSYMAVEVIRGTGYDQSCDWWSLGVILFECLYGFPPFVSKSRHVTRQKILTWRQSLRFPARPKVSREAQDLVSKLICEREERLGSRASPSTIRPNAVLVQQRRSGFLGPAPGQAGLVDGADDIKAHPWFRGIDFNTLHLQEPPFKPELRDPSDTRYFDDDINDEPLPGPEAQAGQADATKDPMLRDKVHGKHLLDVRKQLAFQGYTFKSPRQKVFDPRTGLRALVSNFEDTDDARGRATQREASSGFRRAMSL